MKTTLIHCSYHKCLTVYYMRVVSTMYNRLLRLSKGYRHFNSRIEDFYDHVGEHKIISVNNQTLDFQRLGDDYWITRFIRDPRDLVVSGYFYHKRGPEIWSNLINPVPADYREVNGCVPKGMAPNHSYASYLQSISKEEGLIAEIDFRTYHFDSMRKWPNDDLRVKLFKYEDIIGNEVATFADLLSFYRLSILERWLGCLLAFAFSADKVGSISGHIRDPKPSQWKEHFTEEVTAVFEERYGDLLDLYGYREKADDE